MSTSPHPGDIHDDRWETPAPARYQYPAPNANLRRLAKRGRERRIEAHPGEACITRNPLGTYTFSGSDSHYTPFILEKRKKKPDMVNHPPHYECLKPEPIDVIESWDLPFHEAQVLKYTVRWKGKGGVEDLKKARFYLDRLIARNTPQERSEG